MMDAAPAPSQAYQIFARVQQRWTAQRYPSSVDYIIHVETLKGARVQDRHYRARWSAETDTVSVDAVSQEERAHPYKPPPGFDVSVFGVKSAHIGGPKEGTGVNGDLIGVPMLTPNYFFGIAEYTIPPPPSAADLVREIRDEYHDPAPSKVSDLEKKQGGLRTIANVYSSYYSITLVGEEPVDGHTDYHLKFQPLRDPGKHRLRDLWADESTYDVDKLRVEGNFIDPGTSGVPWTVTFATVNHARYIATETSERSIKRWYDRITIGFEALVPSVGPFYPAHGGESTIREP